MQVRRLHALLRRWPLIPFKYALQLLDYAYPDERVHEFAVKCLNVEEDETIEMFFCQLVQALKHQNYYNSALCSFLLERALKNQRLGHKVAWREHRKLDMHRCIHIFKFIVYFSCSGAYAARYHEEIQPANVPGNWSSYSNRTYLPHLSIWKCYRIKNSSF